MNSKRALIALFACCMLAAALVGCGSNGASSSSERVVTDAYGREVAVPADVQTCATVGSAARFVAYAGGIDKLVAVTELEKATPSRPYTIAWEETFVDLPTTSNGNHLMETSVDGEALLKIAPDVIISSRSAQECDELQEQLGIPVVGISYQDQVFADNVFESIEVVGTVLGTEDHAKGVVEKMRGWQSDLEGRTASIAAADKPACYAGAVNYKGAKSFGGTYAQYPPFAIDHIVNVADGVVESGSVEVTLEQLGEWDPDFMFLNAGNMDLMRKDYENNKAFFDSLTAFKTGNVYTQPSYNMNGTNVEIAICNAYFDGATVYPEAFEDIDLEAKYAEVLSTMLGVDCYEQLKAKGLDFGKLSF